MKKNNIHEIYTVYGKEKLFAILFEEIPQSLQISVTGEGIEDDEFKKLFKNFTEKFSFSVYEYKISDKIISFVCISETLKIVVDVSSWRVVFHFDKTVHGSEALIESLKEFFLPYFKTKQEESAYVALIIKEPTGCFTTRKFKIKKVDFELETHYNDDFLKEHRKINEFLSLKSKSGLVLLHGSPGTGKTFYMRYLINNNKDKNIIYLPNHLMNHLASPDFINFMGNLDSNTILLIEDAEEILKPRKEGNNGAISNLLNMTDGILGDCFALKIFASFNSDLDKIDPALLRKGRLVSKYEFKALSADKTENLIKNLNLTNIQTGSNQCMTLSEIYNYTSENYCEIEKKTKPGFILQNIESDFPSITKK